MKKYHAIVLVPILYEVQAADILTAEASFKQARDKHGSYLRPDGEPAGPYILTIAEVTEHGYGTPVDDEDVRESPPLLGKGRHDPSYRGPDGDGPRAA